MRLLIQNGMVFRDGRFQELDVLVEDGRIADISPDITVAVDEVFPAERCFVFPGLADVHVHLREPGFSYKETMESGTAAAARGGYTAVCAMPNLSPVPDSVEHLAEEQQRIDAGACIRVFPYAAITAGEKGQQLVDFAALRDKAVAFSDDGKGVQDSAMMEAAMEKVAALGGLIAAHCEDESLLHGGYIHDGEYCRRHGHRGICSESEWGPIARDIELVRRTGCRYHVCHVSAKESVELIRRAKAEGLPVTCETGPHYLTLCDEDLQEDGRFKMNPPLRSAADREALLQGLLDGTVDAVATDHAPHSAEEKSRGLEKSLMGVVGLETALPVLHTELVLTGKLTMEKLVEAMSLRPRAIFGLGGGTLRVGEPADLAVFDPRCDYVIEPERFLSKGRATPFAGRRVRGDVILTIADGRIVWKREEN